MNSSSFPSYHSDDPRHGPPLRGSDAASDLRRDEVQCLFKAHDDLIELLYQACIPAVFDIFRTMLKQVALRTDTEEAKRSDFERALMGTPDWNRMTVREVTRSWNRLSKRVILLVRKLGRVKALIMQKSGAVRHAGQVNVTLEFASILHAIVVFSAGALLDNMDALFSCSGSQASMEMFIRRGECVEKAVVHLLRDALTDLLLADDEEEEEDSSSMPSGNGGSAATSWYSTDNSRSGRPPLRAAASASLPVSLRYSLPQITAAPAEEEEAAAAAASASASAPASRKSVSFRFDEDDAGVGDDDNDKVGEAAVPAASEADEAQEPDADDGHSNFSIFDEEEAEEEQQDQDMAISQEAAAASPALAAAAAAQAPASSSYTTSRSSTAPSTTSISRSLAQVLLKDM